MVMGSSSSSNNSNNKHRMDIMGRVGGMAGRTRGNIRGTSRVAGDTRERRGMLGIEMCDGRGRGISGVEISLL